MNDRGFCPPNTIGKDFSNNFVQQETIQNTFNGFSPYDSTTTTTIQVQNGHFGEGPGTSMPYRDTSPMKPMYQHGNASYTPPSYANITAPKNFDPYGYRTQHQQRNISYNVHQQKNPNLVPGSRQPNNFAEEHHSRPSVGFGEFSSQNSGGNTSFGARPSSHPPPFLPNEIPSFHSPASQRSLQQHFGSGGAINQTISDYSIPTGGPNFDMMLYDGGMNGTGNGHQMMMNGGGEFLGDFGPSRDMPAQYVLSNELLCRIDNSTKKQSLLELQIGLEQIAYETTTNFNTWATVIKDRLNVTGRDSLSEMDKFIATEMLVEMSIVLDESQYNFSRLCQFLATNIDKYGPNILLPQVSAFVSETNTLLSPQHLRNLVTFLAELYDKIEINGVKSSQLAAHLFDQLHNVLKLNPLDDQSIGTIVKILKLTGRFLENDRGPQAMDEFFAELGEASRNSSDSAKSKVKNLVALRDKQWGIVAETITSGNSSAYPLVGILGPDGEQLTAEEECNLFDDTFDNFGNSPSGSLYNNPMEEDNVEDDYEQFLQATAIRAAEKALEKVSIDEDDESILSSPKLFSGKQL